MRTISGKAMLAGVLGWPVAHSKSPRLHNFWLQSLAIDGVYVPLPVMPEDLPAVLKALPRMGFRGVNLTIPHKEAAVALMDRLDEGARRIGSVNTVVFEGDGKATGFSTDGIGFIENLRQSQPGFSPAQGPAVLLGAGGAGAAIAFALQDEACPQIRIVNRSRDKAERLAERLGGKALAIDWRDREAALEDAALLVNATSLGMRGQQELDLPLDRLCQAALVTDIVYAPLETDLLARAAKRGNPTVDGLGMLLHQAVPGFEAWFGKRPQVTQALRDHVLGGG